ncbi:3-deoxy-D-manno-octulosonic acid kinase [Shewanella sp. Isolate11]|uniref:3-deoxy-D-manno-octulosonic acid kinase n=1 Tax=Shewanella sp. Isolate11 TaxID=2908530 RepID=UPI001EFCADCC|nr:3-deoxy-D-manno-octulosonic acid kinase [Shewanella sp. Isolate11]MCG9697980.1 3-deoxy-D-manno-octulosonic acid kinase [Shewanella sp. Isolate11]
MQIKRTQAGYIAFYQSELKSITPDWFTFDYWQELGAVTGSSKGRYTTWFVSPQSIVPAPTAEWVLRHYYRGGLMEKFSRDAYLYTGLKRTRAIAEFSLLARLHEEGFAVPKPIAAQVQRSGIHYRADIIIERIEGAQDLVAKLAASEMSQEEWQALGAQIAKFHQRGVYHADLNAKNILISDHGFTLIDFDRGEIRPPSPKWQQANLDRLLRSFNKEKNKLPALQFNERNWQQLLAGYRKS